MVASAKKFSAGAATCCVYFGQGRATIWQQRAAQILPNLVWSSARSSCQSCVVPRFLRRRHNLQPNDMLPKEWGGGRVGFGGCGCPIWLPSRTSLASIHLNYSPVLSLVHLHIPQFFLNVLLFGIAVQSIAGFRFLSTKKIACWLFCLEITIGQALFWLPNCGVFSMFPAQFDSLCKEWEHLVD